MESFISLDKRREFVSSKGQALGRDKSASLKTCGSQMTFKAEKVSFSSDILTIANMIQLQHTQVQ